MFFVNCLIHSENKWILNCFMPVMWCEVVEYLVKDVDVIAEVERKVEVHDGTSTKLLDKEDKALEGSTSSTDKHSISLEVKL